jgi:DNA-binding transcriptional regulator YdaS (Cro superfamily)
MRAVDLFRENGVTAGYVASKLKITAGAVSQWDKIPSSRVLEVERITKIPRHRLRPDLYPAEREAR